LELLAGNPKSESGLLTSPGFWFSFENMAAAEFRILSDFVFARQASVGVWHKNSLSGLS